MMTNCLYTVEVACWLHVVQITNYKPNKEQLGKRFACRVNEAVLKTYCHLKVLLPLCSHVGGGHTSGTAVLWFQILFDVDYLDQEKPVEMV